MTRREVVHFDLSKIDQNMETVLPLPGEKNYIFIMS